MEEGSLRVDANVSVRPAGERGARDQDRAQEHEQLPLPRARHRGRARAPDELLEGGGEVEQETLHFDPRTGALTPLRSKEYAHDYRYFPEPDLVPLAPTEEMMREAARVAARAARRAPRALPRGARALGGGRRDQLAFDAEAWASTSRRVLAPADGAEPKVGRQLGHRRARRGAARGATATLAPRRPSRSPRLVRDGRLARTSRTASGTQVLATAGRRGRRPRAIVEPRACADRRRAGRDRRPRASRPSPRRPRRFGRGEMQGDRARSSARVMKETKGRADGGEVTNADPREARRLRPL